MGRRNPKVRRKVSTKVCNGIRLRFESIDGLWGTTPPVPVALLLRKYSVVWMIAFLSFSVPHAHHPRSIEWEYDPESVVVPVEEFEEYRPPRRTQFDLMLGREERYEILEDEWEIPQSEIAHAIRMNIKAKNQRLRTLNNIGRVSDMEEKLENARRKLKKTISLKKRSSKKGENLANGSSITQQQTMTRSTFRPRERRQSKVQDLSKA